MAHHAAEELALERVLLVPVFLPPHKPPPPDDPGPEHRLAMCAALIAQDATAVGSRLRACPIEIERRGRSYTVDTLDELHARHPDAELTLIVGADMARTLPAWRRPREILRVARVAVAERDDDREEALAALHAVEPRAQVAFLRMGPVEVSSTLVRGRLAEGQPIDDLVGGTVAEYIAGHGLYRSVAAAGMR